MLSGSLSCTLAAELGVKGHQGRPTAAPQAVLFPGGEGTARLHIRGAERMPSVSNTRSSPRGHLYLPKRDFEVAHTKQPHRGKHDDWGERHRGSPRGQQSSRGRLCYFVLSFPGTTAKARALLSEKGQHKGDGVFLATDAPRM